MEFQYSEHTDILSKNTYFYLDYMVLEATGDFGVMVQMLRLIFV